MTIASVISIAAISGVFVSEIEEPDIRIHVAMKDLSLDDQINEAPYAIIGQVKSIGGDYTQSNVYVTRHLSDVIVEVKKVLKGEITEKEITIVTTLNSYQKAKFVEDEKVLLFLWKGSETDVERGNYAVSGMHQGKYGFDQDGSIIDSKDSKIRYQELEIIDEIEKVKSKQNEIEHKVIQE